MPNEKNKNKSIKNYKHKGKRKNIPEVGLVTSSTDKVIDKKKYKFDPFLDPNLDWTGKLEKNELEIDNVSLHVHEKIDSKLLIDKIKNNVESSRKKEKQLNFFDNPEFELPLNKALQFYNHESNWSNRLIAGDSLLVMNSLLEKEGMGGKIQTIFMDPPYGINFKSNFQPFTNQKVVKESDDAIPHEPEMIKAFRDTWELGIHSYLSHLRDRILLCKELLNETGSMFLQINDKNLHHAQEVIEEIFGKENYFGLICFQKVASPLAAENSMPSKLDFLLWYCKDITKIKYHKLFYKRKNDIDVGYNNIELENGERRKLTQDEIDGKVKIPKGKLFKPIDLFKSGPGSKFEIKVDGKVYDSGKKWWGQKKEDIQKLVNLKRIVPYGNSLTFIRYLDDFPYKQLENLWDGLSGARDKVYVVQTNEEIIKRCILMSSDAGEIVFDPTCGGGTTAVASERLGRKWITCDSSRVALNLSRKRIMTEVYDYYKLNIPEEGISGGIKYKQVMRLTPSLIAQGYEGKKETIYLEPEIEKNIKRVSGPFTVEAVPSIRVKNPDSKINVNENEQEIENYINEINTTGIQTIEGKKIKFLNLEKSKAFEYIHAIGQIEYELSHKTTYVSFGPNHGPLEQTQVENAVYELRENLKEESLLIFCAFHFDPEASKDIDCLEHPKIKFLKSQMSVDLLTEDLRKKRSSNQSFWLIGQPDIDILNEKDGYRVKIKGFDYYNPLSSGEIISRGSDNIALWMLDTDYDERSICPDQFFFPINDGNDWTKLNKTLKSEIDLNKIKFFQGTISEKFSKGVHGKIAVKIVDNRGIESLIVKKL
jgi:adenine-specific DNA-methyltransferase